MEFVLILLRGLDLVLPGAAEVDLQIGPGLDKISALEHREVLEQPREPGVVRMAVADEDAGSVHGGALRFRFCGASARDITATANASSLGADGLTLRGCYGLNHAIRRRVPTIADRFPNERRAADVLIHRALTRP